MPGDLLDDLLELTDEQRALRQTVRDFAAKEVAPHVAAADRDEKFNRDVLVAMAKQSLFGGIVPTEYGGLGLDYLSYAVMVEEMARVDQAAALLMSMPSSLAGAGLRIYGTEEQKQKWLRPLAEGATFAAAGVTEPRSGSDVAGMTTTYRVDGDDFVISGSKAWISNLDLAEFLVTFATKDKSLGRRGVSAFVIPAGTAGLEFRPYKDKLGFRSIATGDVFLDEVRVPRENLLGTEGEGFRVAMSAVENGRLTVAARAVGQAQACLDDCLAYAPSREVFGQPISEFQLTKAKVADMASGILSARLLVHAAAKLLDRGERGRMALSIAKQTASDVMQRAATEAVQIHGAYGTSGEYRVSRIYRDAKVFQLIEGTNEIHRLLIADYLFGVRT
jgi:alkylation response protein AidB-like acyl-CoA dehydrogenase